MRNNRLILKHLKRLYKEFYDNGGRQSDIMRETGLKQPTISRYMNGDMPLNINFLTGFMRAIGKSIDELAPYMTPNTIVDVKYTISGKRITESVEIMAMELTESAFGIKVDTDCYGLRKGAILIVCEDIIPSDLDNVVLINKDKPIVYGVLEYKPDMFDSEWAIRTHTSRNEFMYTEVKDPKKVLYVVGVQYPKSIGRKELIR
ncbi:TPA: helix-turn-helix domain-containing protein [Pasteurella multocida]